jgi:hypothetical protein
VAVKEELFDRLAIGVDDVVSPRDQVRGPAWLEPSDVLVEVQDALKSHLHTSIWNHERFQDSVELLGDEQTQAGTGNG